MDKIDDNLLKKIETEIGITAERVEDDLTIIRNWVNQQPHLPKLNDDEDTNQWLYHFLYYSKNRIEKVKKHLEVYFSCKTLMPEFFGVRDPESPDIKANVEALYLITLPKLTPSGHRVHLFCHAKQDPKAYEPKEFMRRALMMCDWKMKHDLTAGDIIIFHMKNSSLGHWARYNMNMLSRFIACFTNAYPLRIKAVHFTEAPSFVTHIINNPFITLKLKKRIKVHKCGNFLKLLEDVPKHCLPVELGGDLNMTLPELNEITYQNIVRMKDWFFTSEKMKSDENKLPEKLKENNLFGCDGTFRCLNLD